MDKARKDRQEDVGIPGELSFSKCGSVAQAHSSGWHTVVLAGEVWALCQEEAPLHPSLYLGQVWSRSLLAGCLWFSLALCAFFLKAVFQRRHQQVAPSLQNQEVIRERAAGQQASLPNGRNVNRPVPLTNALMDSLLLCLLSEALENPCPPHIQALAHRLEMVNLTLRRADVLGDSLQRGGIQGLRGSEEPPLLTDSLQGICTFLQQRVRLLRALDQAQGDYGYSMQGIKEVLEQHWALLVQLHIRVTLRRKRSEAEECVHTAVKKAREGEEEIEMALRNVERFSMEQAQCKGRLQQSRTHLSDITRMLQELGGSLRALGERGGAGTESLWTERLLQSNTQQLEEAVQDSLSLERLTSCFQTHLEGLRVDMVGNGEPRPHPYLSSSARTLPRPPCRPPAPPALPPAATPLTLCERSAQRLSTTFNRLHSSLCKKV
ncbi:hypothetical protein SKAU_G00086940 [Synaphobranchus kaupii]|uniref:Uncharacterized protein n=1 Tax=Synaphobranchus kaupii TaxID=118154 RepID=A0A9Q1FVX2_SYNKA|nr:hypothetical protein SKAU_G00086940 [Synaphobranchus kaupii]